MGLRATDQGDLFAAQEAIMSEGQVSVHLVAQGGSVGKRDNHNLHYCLELEI